jgi:hypothetical protein
LFQGLFYFTKGCDYFEVEVEVLKILRNHFFAEVARCRSAGSAAVEPIHPAFNFLFRMMCVDVQTNGDGPFDCYNF